MAMFMSWLDAINVTIPNERRMKIPEMKMKRVLSEFNIDFCSPVDADKCYS